MFGKSLIGSPGTLEAIDNSQWYKMLLNFILQFAITLYSTKIYVLSNLSDRGFTLRQY